MFKAIWKNKNNNTVINNYIALLLIQGANFILPLITLPYLVRTLGSEKYGLVMIAQSLAIFFTIIVDFGFNISATREVSIVRKNKKKLSQLYWNVFFVKFCLIVVTFSLLLLLTLFVNRFKIEPIVYLLSFGLVIGQAIFPTWFFQGIERMFIITIIHVIAKVIFTLGIFIFVLSPNDYEYVPLFNGGGFILSGLLGFLISLKYVNYVKPNFYKIKLLIKESFALFTSNFAVSLYTSGNTFILGVFWGDTIAGVYASMEKLVIALKSIYIPIYQAIFPRLSAKPKETIYLFIKKMKLPITISGLLISLLILIAAKPILGFVFNDNLIERYSEVFQILGFIALFSSLNMLYVSLLFPAIKAYKVRMFSMVSGGIFNLTFSLLVVKFYGIYGIAASAVISEMVILILAVYFFNRNFKNA